MMLVVSTYGVTFLFTTISVIIRFPLISRVVVVSLLQSGYNTFLGQFRKIPPTKRSGIDHDEFENWA
jgi:hypothetical protein